MNIAVIFTKGKTEGGAFQYSLSLSLLLEKNRSGRYNFFFFTTVKENIKILEKHGLHFRYLRWSGIDRFMSLIFNSRLLSGMAAKLKINLCSRIDRVLSRYNINLIYFLNPSDLALSIDRFNYIFTIWDLSFLEHIEFPELYMNKEFERRDRLYQSALRKAVKVITDSDISKNNIIQKYGIDGKRALALPFLPANAADISNKECEYNYIDIKQKYRIKNKYIFYPAQFWPHKNHLYILEGIRFLKEKYKVPLSAVFSGSDKGNLHFVLKKAEEFGIADQIHYIGFVEDRELPYLYKQALALVMPTYFGPTNIPPLEAFAMGCPVLYSDLQGLREQVEGSAILLDLNDPDSMCRGLLKIIENPAAISTIIENGRKKIEYLIREDRWGMLKSVFDDYAVKLKCWK